MQNWGKYFLFLSSTVRNREPFRVYPSLILDEMVKIGTNSLVIVAIVSTFIGMVTCLQTADNLVSPLVPMSVIGTICRDMTLLELAPTFTCVVLAGKVGSNLAGEIGSMRITEQIDAIDVMGINSSSYLILPKIIAACIMIPALCILAAFLSLMGGYLIGEITGAISPTDFVAGIRNGFRPFNVFFALTKSFVFAFLISTISSYKGYFTFGGALEIGQASTKAVTNSVIGILIADLILAKIMI
ncbi:MAG TPA: ABC transporter permease [Catalimonadaceae bacterium]|nr:ABC transporter permease [Catalimonadaceae bacterium]HPI09435.1 ABC transporter permease [Catalimonadaceae bacterium]